MKNVKKTMGKTTRPSFFCLLIGKFPVNFEKNEIYITDHTIFRPFTISKMSSLFDFFFYISNSYIVIYTEMCFVREDRGTPPIG